MTLIKRKRDEDDDDDRRIVPDGGRVRVPVTLMDGDQRERAAFVDAVIHRELDQPDLSMHRPGFRYADADSAAVADAAWHERNRRLSDAWKQPPAKVEQPKDDRLPDDHPLADARAAADAAWHERNERVSNAWRGPNWKTGR